MWRRFAAGQDIEVKVFYACSHGLEPTLDPGFGRTFAWDVPLTEGYEHEFLPSIRCPLFHGPAGDRFPTGLASRLAAGRFQAVLVNGYATAAAWAGMLAARKLDVPILMRGETHERGRKEPVKWAIKRLMLPIVFSRVSGFAAIGTWNTEYWLRYGAPSERVSQSLYSVDNEFFRIESERQAEQALTLRRRWAAPEGETVFLFCAKLIPAKAPELLLKAFALLDYPKAHLVFVGSGGLEPMLRNLQSELGLARVHWEGFVNQSALPAYYRAANILVLPSRHEPWGLVVNEAMACGTPCIVSDVVGAGPDLVQPGPSGLIFRHDDPEDLALVLRMALDPEARRDWQARIGGALKRACFDENEKSVVRLLESLRDPHGDALSAHRCGS